MYMRRLSITLALAAIGTVVGLVAGTTAGPVKASSQVTAVDASATSPQSSELAQDVMIARAATAKYAANLARARSDGYRILTRMIPTMGYHFINPGVTGFDLRKPPILVYERQGNRWQLGALEWVFPSIPRTPPLPGAKYGVFGAACHYVDGTFVFAAASSRCPRVSPQTGARFRLWHPRLVTLHFWVWYPNASGIYSGTNPFAAPFNGN
jgi:hypothetical protein